MRTTGFEKQLVLGLILASLVILPGCESGSIREARLERELVAAKRELEEFRRKLTQAEAEIFALKTQLSTLTSIAPAPARQPPVIDRSPQTTEQTQGVTVYVTRTGSKYHRASCRYLRQSSIPIALNDARKRYSPCSVCGP